MKTPTGESPNDKASRSKVTGHRTRMRTRIIEKGANTLTDLELLEIILYGGNPRGDTKPLAKDLFAQFGSLSAILRAPIPRLLAIPKIGQGAIACIKVAEAAALHLSYNDIKSQPVLASWGAINKHCINRLTHEKIEIFLMISLDSQNRVIAEDEVSRGTIDQTPVYIREVINVALRNNAKSVLLVHNHPSGETEPSEADISMTKELRKAFNIMTINLHDHLIVAAGKCISLRSLGYL